MPLLWSLLLNLAQLGKLPVWKGGFDEVRTSRRRGIKALQGILTDQFGREIVSVHLFGSKARGDASRESDIDILVVTQQDDWRLKERIGKVATRVLLDWGVYLSVKVLGKPCQQKLVSVGSPFIRNILREGILL